MGLVVLGFEQSSVWGWSSPATWGSLIVGMLLMVAFVRWELRTPDPLLQLRIFSDRGFAADTAVLGLMSVVFVPFFFFASVYSQVSLGKTSSQAGLYLLYFFLGYVIASQIGGRILDRRGARPAIVFGCAISAVGFFLLAGKLTDLSLSEQWLYVAIAGAGIGLMLTPASTDAVNRAPSTSLQRGHGHHPDGPQFRSQSRLGGPRLCPHSPGEYQRYRRAHQGGRPEWHCSPNRRARSGPARRRQDRAPDSHTRWCTTYSSRSRTRPRPFSTSWRPSWRQRSSSRSGACRAGAWRWPRTQSPPTLSRVSS